MIWHSCLFNHSASLCRLFGPLTKYRGSSDRERTYLESSPANLPFYCHLWVRRQVSFGACPIILWDWPFLFLFTLSSPPHHHKRCRRSRTNSRTPYSTHTPSNKKINYFVETYRDLVTNDWIHVVDLTLMQMPVLQDEHSSSFMDSNFMAPFTETARFHRFQKPKKKTRPCFDRKSWDLDTLHVN